MPGRGQESLAFDDFLPWGKKDQILPGLWWLCEMWPLSTSLNAGLVCRPEDIMMHLHESSLHVLPYFQWDGPCDFLWPIVEAE